MSLEDIESPPDRIARLEAELDASLARATRFEVALRDEVRSAAALRRELADRGALIERFKAQDAGREKGLLDALARESAGDARALDLQGQIADQAVRLKLLLADVERRERVEADLARKLANTEAVLAFAQTTRDELWFDNGRLAAALETLALRLADLERGRLAAARAHEIALRKAERAKRAEASAGREGAP